MFGSRSAFPLKISARTGVVVAASVLAMDLIAVACADSPTKPRSSLSASTAQNTIAVNRAVTSPLIADASGRLAGSVADAVARDKLRRHLALLSKALDEGQANAVRRELALVRNVIAEREKTGDGADLAAVSLALDQIETQLSATPTKKQ